MDFSSMTRDPSLWSKLIKERADGSVTALQDCKIIIPRRFLTSHLATEGASPTILGAFALVSGDKYTVFQVNAMVSISPDEVNSIQIDEEYYVEYIFYAGATVINTVQLIKDKVILYYIYYEFSSLGKMPVYMDYDKDAGEMFDSSVKHAGSGYGCDRAIVAIHIALRARDPKAIGTAWRHSVKSMEELKGVRPVMVGARNVSVAVQGTVNQVTGSHIGEGITGAIVDPSKKSNTLERILTG